MVHRYYGPVVKTLAFVMAMVLAGLCLVAAIFTAELWNRGMYTKSLDALREDSIRDQLVWTAHDVAQCWVQDTYGGSDAREYDYYYDGDYYPYCRAYYPEKSNFRYEIFGPDGKRLGGNYEDQPVLATEVVKAGGLVYTYRAYPGGSDDLWQLETGTVDSNLIVKGYVLRALAVEDEFTSCMKWTERMFRWRWWALGGMLLSALLCLALVVYLFCGAGRRKGVPGITLSQVDRIPPDVLLLAMAVSGAALTDYWNMDMEALLLSGVILSALGGITALSLAARIKLGNGSWYRSSLCWRLGARAIRFGRESWGLIPLAARWLAVGGACVLVTAASLRMYAPVLFVLSLAAEAGLVVYVSLSLARLQKRIHGLAQGEPEGQTGGLTGSFRRMDEDLQTLGTTVNRAVEQRIRSERMRTELITNVSHDIKTPLTAIVSYVDLLQKPHTEQEEREYLEVLDRQSRKLKKLTQDLIDASKASSGVMAPELARTNLVELVNQAVGEYGEKMEEAGLEIVLNVPEVETYAMVDGRLIWRVLDNLLSNCTKYSQRGTRVYVTLTGDEHRAVLTVRNISREPLNLPVEELMERFVRGDRARLTEGSGLGLNIARSLTELQGGTLIPEIDGDLFKVTMSVPAA